ncbi:MAG: tripartite tricarboxylate transporter substrate binding protein [Pseudomonadota bacterium]
MLAALAGSAAAADYPLKPLRMIITYPPGGNTDAVGRPVAARLSEVLGQQVLIDNRGGAGGTLGTHVAAQATPDGYTMLMGTSASMSINPALQPKLPYDPNRDFAPVTMLVINPQVLVVHPSSPFRSVKELIAHAKSNPGKLNYASPGIGSPNHLGTELFQSMANIEMVHVAYRGGGPASADLIAGQVQLMFSSMPAMMAHARAGRLRALAVGSGTRSPAAPELPTVAEAGVPGFEYLTWYGIFLPAKSPVRTITILNRSFGTVLADPEVSKMLSRAGSEPLHSTPAELARFMKAEGDRWTAIAKRLQLKVD